MKKSFNYKKLFVRILIILFIVYFISVMVNQQDKLNTYKQASIKEIVFTLDISILGFIKL